MQYHKVVRHSVDGTKQAKLIFQLSEHDLTGCAILGSGSGPLLRAFVAGDSHTKDFFDRVIGYTVSEEGIGKLMADTFAKSHPELLEKTPEMRLTFTFYEKT